MTCVVGIESIEGVTIGVDSASSNGHTVHPSASGKLFRNGPLLLGFTTSWRMGQLLRYSMYVPTLDTWDVDRWMATTFIDTVRRTLKDGGWASLKDGAEEGGTFLVGIAGRLYTVHGDYQATRSGHGYNSVGSGSTVALGALHSAADKPAHERAIAALTAAAEHVTSVAAPFEVVTI